MTEASTTTAATEGTAEVVDWAASTEEFVEVNWEKISKDELVKGYMRQSDYTKKTQEISKEREQLQMLQKKSDDWSSTTEDEALLKRLKERWVVTKDELERVKIEATMDQSFSDILRTNPELKQHEAAIRALQKSEGTAWEDVITKYGFASADKLEKAKQGKMVGDSSSSPKVKDPMQMTDKEWEQYKLEKSLNKSWMEEVGVV